MDRTAWIVVIACVAGMLLYGSWYNKETQKAAEAIAAQRAQEEEAKAAAAGQNPDSSTQKPTDPAPGTGDTDPGKPGVPTPAVEKVVEQTFVLENDFIRCHLTNLGAGIAEVELLQHDRTLGGGDGHVTINDEKPTAIGALSTGPGLIDTTGWTVVKNDGPNVVAFIKDLPEGLRIQKRFSLPSPPAEGSAEETAYDPHLVKLKFTVRNISGTATTVSRKFLYTGAARPLHVREWSREIGYFWKGGGEDMEFESVDALRKGMFRKARTYDEFPIEQLEWAGVNDQFYATLIRAEQPANATMWASRTPMVIAGEEELSKKKKLHAVMGGVGLPDIPLAVDDQRTLDYEFYLGPKEFHRLRALGEKRKAIMHYDELPIIGWLFGWAIKPLAALLITSLVWMHKFMPFGVAIILTTILIRIIIWPLYAKSTRTMKRMSKLTPKMKEIKEQYKDDPTKQNQEIMGLYKKYGVNPLGGCLPMFVQMPVFLGFYRMLSSAVELRHESFLWVDDLSMPDTLFEVPGLNIPFNLLPLLMAVTMVIQMKVTPQSGDATQRMIFMLMPVVFLVICYNFASALSLYWTTTNIFSIAQTLLMNKLPEPELKKKKLPEGGKAKKGFMQRLQEQAEAQQKAKKAQSGGGGGGEKGNRHTPGKSKKRKKR